MATTRYIDLAYTQDEDGIYDLVIDAATGDFVTTDGLETAILVSEFSDARADESEVPDPMQRRGWIGDLVSGEPQDRHGSKLWLYEQRRLTEGIANSVRVEAEQALDWMVEEGLARYVAGDVVMIPSERRIDLVLDVHFPNGGRSTYAYVLADATRNGTIARL